MTMSNSSHAGSADPNTSMQVATNADAQADAGSDSDSDSNSNLLRSSIRRGRTSRGLTSGISVNTDITTNTSISTSATMSSSNPSIGANPYFDPSAPLPLWSTAAFNDGGAPATTSPRCLDSLSKLMNNNNSDAFSLVVESSSHPAGVQSLWAQPWMYGGPGLGNMQECPYQTCIAGTSPSLSVIFASVCMVQECTAYDLASSDFLHQLANVTNDDTCEFCHEYDHIFAKIHEVNSFLGTGWTCGTYIPAWDVVPSTIYVLFLLVSCLFCLLSRQVRVQRQQRQQQQQQSSSQQSQSHQSQSSSSSSTHILKHQQSTTDDTADDAIDDVIDETSDTDSSDLSPSLETKGLITNKYPTTPALTNGNAIQSSASAKPMFSSLARSLASSWESLSSIIVHWDIADNTNKLLKQRPETACLDGLKVFSILWIMYGHCLAIQAGSGGGFLNPADVFPPHGYTTTMMGQLVFSSRFAVDTFFCISGYLVVLTIQNKMQGREAQAKKLSSLVCIPLMRILRILPLYGAILAFWILIAKHCGSVGGPFWYQWHSLLEPCHNHMWLTNVLFINNLIPWDQSSDDACLGHSWYLAVDMQLFIMLVPILLLCRKPMQRKIVAGLFASSVSATVILTYVNGWSVNTFDGAAIARFDIEGYAKPHIRAQAYLAGMWIGLMESKIFANGTPHAKRNAMLTLLLVLAGLAAVSLITVTGAYARRACQYYEWPSKDPCGSTWSPFLSLLYSGTSRAVWSLCIATLIKLCLDGHGYWVGGILSWRIWTPLAHLSFGAYLIHPIIHLIWQVGKAEKLVFQVSSLAMTFVSIATLSFAVAYIAAILVELPFRNVLCFRAFGDSRRATPERRPLITEGTCEVAPSSYQSIAQSSRSG